MVNDNSHVATLKSRLQAALWPAIIAHIVPKLAAESGAWLDPKLSD
jgi:hypothetical protein